MSLRLRRFKRPICWIMDHKWKLIPRKKWPPEMLELYGHTKIFGCLRCAKPFVGYPVQRRHRRTRNSAHS